LDIAFVVAATLGHTTLWLWSEQNPNWMRSMQLVAIMLPLVLGFWAFDKLKENLCRPIQLEE